MTYDAFLRSKVSVAPESGFDVEPAEVSPALKPHQRDAVCWACKGGRRALFESFGLGKTAQELEWCRLVVKHAGGRALIVLPLGVRQEFTRDAVKLLGMEHRSWRHSRLQTPPTPSEPRPASRFTRSQAPEIRCLWSRS